MNQVIFGLFFEHFQSEWFLDPRTDIVQIEIVVQLKFSHLRVGDSSQWW